MRVNLDSENQISKFQKIFINHVQIIIIFYKGKSCSMQFIFYIFASTTMINEKYFILTNAFRDYQALNPEILYVMPTRTKDVDTL